MRRKPRNTWPQDGLRWCEVRVFVMVDYGVIMVVKLLRGASLSGLMRLHLLEELINTTKFLYIQ